MTRYTLPRDVSVIEAEGVPGGRRLIQGKNPTRCVHRRPLRARLVEGMQVPTVEQLCALCVYELHLLGKRE